MTFKEAVKTFYSRYTDFQGRSRRAEYWWFMLYFYGIVFVLAILAGFFGADFEDSGAGSPVGAIIFLLVGLLFLSHFIGLLALSVRRFHDLNQTGWLVLVFGLVSLIPFIGFLASIGQIV